MMDWTDRHCRAFHRVLAPTALLYTEMVHANAVLQGDRERLLGFDAREHPVVLQLGGSEPERLAAARAWVPRMATMRSTSTLAARPIACRPGASVPV